MRKIKFFIGPMSKNIVDSILSYTKTHNRDVGLIPSRRQVEHDGGYVNNWTTEAFASYAQDLFLCRDHAGPMQGYRPDNGLVSLESDCGHFDMIHIDPWKKNKDLRGGIDLTAELINYCHNKNNKILYEIGTEQSIRPFSAAEVDTMITELQKRLSPDVFDKIKYCVIQSGTSLQETTNTGKYEEKKLQDMISVTSKYGLFSKEHNGDFLKTSLIKQKFDLGLDSINIAPEFGQIETNVYLENIRTQEPSLLDRYWQICLDSGRWKKWVSKSFNPQTDKIKLIKICGHYVLSDRDFIKDIKNKLKDIDSQVQERVHDKLEDLFC
jgi:D-tagatose-1,6-bisphosphate aldolase subunit GatZ/KbaZ